MDKNNKELDNSLKLIVRTSFIVFIGIFLSKILSYVYRIIIARYFGPEIYGIFSLALIILGWAIAFSSLGLTDGLVRFIPFYRGKKEFNKIRYLIKFVITLTLISSIICSFILFILSDSIALSIFKNSELTIFLKFFSILLPIAVISNVYLSVIRAFEKISIYSFLVNILQNIIKLTLLIILVIIGLKSNSIIFSYFLGVFIICIIAYFVSKYKIPEIFGFSNLNKKDKLLIKKGVFSYSWPIMFSGIFISLLYWIDSLVIGFYLGATSVGIYNAAIPIVALFGFAQELFMQLMFPLINREYSKKNFELIKEISKQISKWIFILDLPLFIIIFLFPGAIINTLFGQDYLGASNALRILSIGIFVSFLIPVLTNLMSMVGKSKILLINLVIASTINLILNIFLVQKFGIEGAAIATSIVSVIMFIMLFFETKYYVSIIPLRRKMLRILLVSIIPLIMVLLIKSSININMFSLIIIGAFYFLSYLALIFLTKCLDDNDIKIILEIIKKTRFSSKIIHSKN